MNTKYISLAIFLIQLSLNSFSQVVNGDTIYIHNAVEDLYSATSVQSAESMAKADLKTGFAYLILQSGISPVVFSTDSIFEAKYGVRYYESGCSGLDKSIVSAYNKAVFEHLTSRRGKAWMKEVRLEVIGFNEWKRSLL